MKLLTLLNCPFCGDCGGEIAETEIPIAATGGKKIAVYCNSCFCEGPPAHTDVEAVDAWNQRAGDTPVPHEAEFREGGA